MTPATEPRCDEPYQHIVHLERIAAMGWPAPDTERLGGWLLRAGDGWTRRANSVLPLGPPGVPLDAALEHVSAWYAARRLPTVFSVPLPAQRALDDELAARGWHNDLDVEVLTADLDPGSDPDPDPDPGSDPGVVLADRPPPGWTSVYRGATPLPPIAARILTAPPTVAFATVSSGDTVVATGRGVVTDGWLGIAAIEVAPAHRGRGHARRITRALQRWGAGRGARRCYLQVSRPNTPATTLYAALGFIRHHSYRNRVR